MHVSIIVPSGGAILSSIVGPYKVFSFINEYLMSSGQADAPFYEIDLVGMTDKTHLYGGIFSVNPTKNVEEIRKTDLIIVSTLMGPDLAAEIEKNQPFIPWIQKMHREKNTEVASLCMGAFLLAATGLLDGKKCSTHWSAEDRFRRLFPRVNLVPDCIITEERGIYSSGGSYSFLNLILYLIHKYNGKEAANQAARMFEIEIDRDSQSPFFVLQGQKEHEDLLIKKIQTYIEENYAENISLDKLASQFNLSKRNLIRRFKKATYNTPNQYLQRVKMEAAKRNLEKTNQSISEIMYDTGYNDIKSFRQTFKKFVGITPSLYRNKYGRA